MGPSGCSTMAFSPMATHKGCQLEPNFARMLGLVLPTICQVYTTIG